MKNLLLCIGLLLVCLAGCRYDVADDIAPAETCDTLVTYERTIQPILSKNCSRCHSGSDAPADVRFDSYADTKKVVEKGVLLGVVKHLPDFPAMPFDGGKLSDCNINQIEQWIKAESPNN